MVVDLERLVATSQFLKPIGFQQIHVLASLALAAYYSSFGHKSLDNLQNTVQNALEVFPGQNYVPTDLRSGHPQSRHTPAHKLEYPVSEGRCLRTLGLGEFHNSPAMFDVLVKLDTIKQVNQQIHGLQVLK